MRWALAVLISLLVVSVAFAKPKTEMCPAERTFYRHEDGRLMKVVEVWGEKSKPHYTGNGEVLLVDGKKFFVWTEPWSTPRVYSYAFDNPEAVRVREDMRL